MAQAVMPVEIEHALRDLSIHAPGRHIIEILVGVNTMNRWLFAAGLPLLHDQFDGFWTYYLSPHGNGVLWVGPLAAFDLKITYTLPPEQAEHYYCL